MSAAPSISVVVIGRNEGQRLVRCLESVARMAAVPGGIECIYVDSESGDDSIANAAAFGATVLSIPPGMRSAAAARNVGWKAARGRLVFFVDGDTVVDPRFAADSLRHFDDPTVAVVWGNRREIDTESSLYNRVLDLDWIYPPGWSEFCGGDALVRRYVLEAVGGFDESLVGGEEPEMCRRIRGIGYGILHVDRPMTRHDLAMHTWKQYWRRAQRAGYAYAAVSRRRDDEGPALWEDIGRANAKHVAVLAAAGAAWLLATLVTASPLPTLLALAAAAALLGRSAWRARWKHHDPVTLLLYAAHSHVQQFPILAGQWMHLRERRGGAAGLVWYKENA